MSQKPCPPGCTCRKHVKLSPEQLAARGRAISAGKKGKSVPVAPCAPGCTCRKHDVRSEEYHAARGAAISRGKHGKRNGDPARGWYDQDGYRMLTGQQGHPLADGKGQLGEHRKVLYAKIGPGSHPCHWECGRILEWGGLNGICADHLDEDTTNNSPDNLVPSCVWCNRVRGQHWWKQGEYTR